MRSPNLRRLMVLGALAGVAGVAPPARAMCFGGTHWNVEPGFLDDLPLNGRFVLHVSHDDEAGLRALLHEGWVLHSADDEIPLVVESVHAGMLHETMVILRPLRPPPAGVRFDLEPRRGWIPGARHPSTTFALDAPADERVPRWRSAARVVDYVNEELGCGPRREVVVEVNPEDDDAHLIVEVTLRFGDRDHSFLYPPVEKRIAIGHHMCGGGFLLEPGTPYVASLQLLDRAGHRSEAQLLRFTLPVEPRYDEEVRRMIGPNAEPGAPPPMSLWKRLLLFVVAPWVTGYVAVSLFLAAGRRRLT